MEYKFKVGDKVVIHGVISDIDTFDDIHPYYVSIVGNDEKEWHSESILSLDVNAETKEEPKKTYEDGLKDVWKFMKKITDTDMQIIRDIYGSGYSLAGILEYHFPQVAMSKYEEYEKKKILHVGDEVTRIGSNNARAIVTGLIDKIAYLLWNDGTCGKYPTSELEKTGYSFDITSILKGIQKNLDAENWLTDEANNG